MLNIRLHRTGFFCHSLSTPSFDSFVFASAHKNPSLQIFSTHYTEKGQITVLDLNVNIL